MDALASALEAFRRFAAIVSQAYPAAKPIRRVRENGKVYLRYSGAHLRVIRARNGVGRPPRRAAL